jgi:hypothetical protein
MKKHLLIATAAAAALVLPIISAGAAGAQPDQPAQHHKFSAEDHAAFTDAKIAALKAGLKLTAAQEKNWPALETVLREVAKARAARAAEWADKAKEFHEHRNLLEGLRLRSAALATKSAELSKVADAAKPLYDTLDDAQKHRFAILLHAISAHGHHFGLHHGEHSDDHEESEHHE